jgi:hypothetical protein
MFGTRNFLLLHNQLHSDNSEDKDIIVVNELLRMSKKLSQVIAYIWLHKNSQIAVALSKYFTDPHKKVDDLLFAQEGEEAYWLLLAAFGDQKDFLPIFKPSYKKYWGTKVIYDAFEGYISDIQRDKGNYLICHIPYPPRPIISDDESDKTAPLSQKDLQEWILSPSNESPYCSPNPYIPTTCT